MRSDSPPRVLIVEDDPFIGMDLMAQLEDAGFAVGGVAGTVAKALRLLDGNAFDVAVVDLNLGRESSAPIAAALTERGIPFVVVTGYSVGQCLNSRRRPCCPSPCNPRALWPS